MSGHDEPSPPPSSERLEEFDRRLRERLKAREARKRGKKSVAASGLGIAWRLSVELVASLGVGLLLGYGLDRLFGTLPWLMLVGGGFGFAAGVRNAIRAAHELQALAAPHEEPRDADEPRRE